MRFELINPSDKIFLNADDLRVAQIAALYAGKGYYGLNDENGEQVFGLIAFGGSEDFIKSFGDEASYKKFVEDKKREIADCLKTFRTDGVRTSMNDICGNAHRLAAQVYANLEKGAQRGEG